MVPDALALLLGTAMPVVGSDRTVGAAVTVARERELSTFFVGVTLVSVGSSLPEIATAAYGQGSLAVGHIVGSATSQITLGIGFVALLAPLSADSGKITTYGIGMLAAMAAMLVAVSSGVVGRAEGVALVLAYLGFVALRYEATDFEGPGSRVGDDNSFSIPSGGASSDSFSWSSAGTCS